MAKPTVTALLDGTRLADIRKTAEDAPEPYRSQLLFLLAVIDGQRAGADDGGYAASRAAGHIEDVDTWAARTGLDRMNRSAQAARARFENQQQGGLQ